MVIYCVENKVNGKKYVGRKDATAEEFLASSYYGSGWAIKEAIKKYGKDNFVRSIVEVCSNDGNIYMCERETHWILQLNTLVPNGYNFTTQSNGCGGKYNHPLYGTHRSEETKKKLSTALAGRLVHEPWNRGLAGKGDPRLQALSAKRVSTMIANRYKDDGVEHVRNFTVNGERKAFKRLCFVHTEEEIEQLKKEYTAAGYYVNKYRVETPYASGFWFYARLRDKPYVHGSTVRKFLIDEQALAHKYVDEHKSIVDIAYEMGYSQAVVYKRIKQLGLKHLEHTICA